MAGKDLTDISDVSALTSEDLRCIALFLSNYYLPFSTVLDNSDAEVAASNKANMVDCLKKIGFDGEAADCQRRYHHRGRCRSYTSENGFNKSDANSFEYFGGSSGCVYNESASKIIRSEGINL